jgi:hypothetical protein
VAEEASAAAAGQIRVHLLQLDVNAVGKERLADFFSGMNRKTTQSAMFYSVLRIRDVLSRIRPFSHPGSGSKHFFIPDPGSYMKSGMQT